MRVSVSWAVPATALVLAACGGSAEPQPAGVEGTSVPAPATTEVSTGTGVETAETVSSPETVDLAAPLDFGNVETVAGGLEVPWAIAFVDEDTMLVTERPGRVRVVEGGSVREEPAAEIDVVAEGEGGLLGIALDPGFPDEPFAYVYYTGEQGNRIARFRVTDDLRLVDEQVLVDGIPRSSVHNGGRLAFGPDGLLYAGTGDAAQPELAADPGSLAGKVLRIRPDGTVPADNPFDGSPVYTWGHRNPQGLAWDSEGRLYESEHGPSGEFDLCCHDELNLLEAGSFYGWPFRAGTTVTRAETALPEQGGSPAQQVDPLAEAGSDTTWAPAGLVVREEAGGGPATLYVATLAGEALLAFTVTDGDMVEGPEAVLDGYGRLRAAVNGPDGCLYLTTSNTDGRGDPAEEDDRILRVCPAG